MSKAFLDWYWGSQVRVDSQLAEGALVPWDRMTEEWASAAHQLGQLAQGQLGDRGWWPLADGQGHQDFIGVQARFRLTRCLIFRFWMGSMTMGEMRWMSF